MTFDVSLSSWQQTGIFEREIALYRRLAQRGVQVTLFSYGHRDDLAFEREIAPVRVLPLWGARRLPGGRILRRLWSLALPWRYRREFGSVSLLKTNQMFGAWVAVITKWLTRKPLLVRCGFDFHRFLVDGGAPWLRREFWRALSSAVYRSADLIVVTSETDLAHVQSVFHIPRSRIRLIPNYVETDRFRPLAASERYPNRVLCIARLESQKNLLALLEALRGTDIELDVLGEGTLRAQLETIIRRHALRVRLLGRVPHGALPEQMNRYGVYILPSLYEGHPKSLLEAMSCGLSVIGANVVGVRELIRHGETGYLCEPTPEAIRSALQTVLVDEPLRKRMGKGARETILQQFTLDRVVELELAAYQQTIENAA